MLVTSHTQILMPLDCRVQYRSRRNLDGFKAHVLLFVLLVPLEKCDVTCGCELQALHAVQDGSSEVAIGTYLTTSGSSCIIIGLFFTLEGSRVGCIIN